jgi:hypothetical protein
MPYKLFWQEEQTLIYFEIIGDFTKDEMYEMCYRLRDEFLSKTSAKATILIDAQSVTSHPQDLRMLREATNIYSNHPNLSWMIFLGISNPITRYITNVLFQMVGTRFRTVTNLEEALEIVNMGQDTAHARPKSLNV